MIELNVTETCKCKLGSEEKACSTMLTQDESIESWNNRNKLSSTELDLIILGIIQSSLNYTIKRTQAPPTKSNMADDQTNNG